MGQGQRRTKAGRGKWRQPSPGRLTAKLQAAETDQAEVFTLRCSFKIKALFYSSLPVQTEKKLQQEQESATLKELHNTHVHMFVF